MRAAVSFHCKKIIKIIFFIQTVCDVVIISEKIKLSEFRKFIFNYEVLILRGAIIRLNY